jgi:CRISPR-associated protein (TIGR02584 family)
LETILLAVTGMSPAVLTETLWALAHEPEPVIPARVIALTTAAGRETLRQRLFNPSPALANQAPWEALRAALQHEGHDLTARLRFGPTPDDIRVITALDPVAGQSRELADIRDRADNEAAADFFLEQVRAIVENPDTHLIVSVAGGRKTMSALLYACLTLVGRETDRLTHVLVSDPFDTLPDFWFPAQPGGPLRPVRSDQPAESVHPADARVDLADVPFVPLRNLFQRELGAKPGSFLRLVERCRTGIRQRAAEHLKLTLDTARAELDVNGQTLKLTPAEMLVACFLARRARHHEPPYTAYKDALDDLNAFRIEQRQEAAARGPNDWRLADSLRQECDDRFITRSISELRGKLQQRGGDAALLAACLPEKGRCSLDLPGPMIFIR